MAIRVIDDSKLQDIAVAIQGKDGGGQMTVDEMPTRIAAIQAGNEVLFSSDGKQYTRNIAFPNNVTKIGENAFSNCTLIESIDFNNVSTIGTSAFANAIKNNTIIDLKNVTYLKINCFRQSGATKVIGKKVEEIDYSAFYYFAKIKTAVFNSVKKIGRNAFLYATLLESIDCRTVEIINSGAFEHTNLKLIDLTTCSNPPTISSDSFDHNTLWTAVVADNTSKTDLQNATNWSIFASNIKTIAEVEAEVGMTYNEYYYQIFGVPRNEVTA